MTSQVASREIWYSDDRGMWGRIVAALSCAGRMATRRATGTQIVASYPSLAQPAFSFPLRTAAATYAHGHLLPPPPDGLVGGLLYRVLYRAMACDPRIGAIVAVRVPATGDIDVDQINERCAAAGEPGRATSALAIHTTRPVWLLFDATVDRPLWSVRLGEGAELQSEYEVLTMLSRSEASLVPRPILCEPWQGDQWISVHEGVAGLPWFRFGGRQAAASLSSRVQMVIRTLDRLHRAIQLEPQWERRFDLRAEIAGHVARCAELGVLPDGIAEAAERCAPLDVTWFLQHGDFSLNNVILRPDDGTVIDFEEFGMTSAPLHDELGLGFSVMDATNEPDGPAWLAACVEPTLARHPGLRPHVPGLILHHLLCRLAACAGRPERSAILAVLQHRLRHFVETSADGLPASLQP